jgi:hypothetical protein
MLEDYVLPIESCRMWPLVSVNKTFFLNLTYKNNGWRQYLVQCMLAHDRHPIEIIKPAFTCVHSLPAYHCLIPSTPAFTAMNGLFVACPQTTLQVPTRSRTDWLFPLAILNCSKNKTCSLSLHQDVIGHHYTDQH